ncbi:MAG: ferrous iron transport protein B [Bacteroidetes bacterium]|nr:ferrous iron transport protein B [Bacteroidota bacterium]
MKKEEKLPNVYLAGNPNCGKSSIFNIITGLQQKTSNVPGTTIEIRSSVVKSNNGKAVKLFDLPGLYSINPVSKDEQIACEPLLNPEHKNYPDHVIVVADMTNLKRNLLLFTQISDLSIPVSLVLNMADIAEKKGVDVDIERLEKELGIIVFKTSVRKGLNIDKIKELVFKNGFKSHFKSYEPPSLKQFVTNTDIDISKFNDYQALQLAYRNTEIVGAKAHRKIFEEQRAMEVMVRYKSIDKLLSKTVKIKDRSKLFSEKADIILTHKIGGYLIFLIILAVIFQSVFKLAEYPMSLIENMFNYLGNFFTLNLEKGIFQSLVVNGILAGLSGVITFIPQIVILFFFLAIIEDSGYMARVSFILDKVMKKFGMNGKSVLPIISGAACAIPAIMSTRTIENKRDRLITILVTPFISCSARLPVYIMMISIIPIDYKILGIFNHKGFLLMAMYILGVITSLIAAVVLSKVIKNTEHSGFIMEMPNYQIPRLKNIATTCYIKAKSFIWEAGKIIFIISMILWYLTSFGPSNKIHNIEQNIAEKVMKGELSHEQANSELMSEKQKYSYAGYFGRSIEPFIKPLGFDWRIGISLITSFIAREVFVGSMATIYGTSEENFVNIREKMQSEINPETNQPFFSIATCLSLMVFYALAMQCASTLAVVYKETKRWKWPIIQFVLMGITAWLASFVTYNIFF